MFLLHCKETKVLGGVVVSAARCTVSRKRLCLIAIKKSNLLSIDLTLFCIDQEANDITENFGMGRWWPGNPVAA